MTIPARLLEATNGMLWLVLAFAAIGAAWCLFVAARQIGSLKQLYLEEKAPIALLVGFGGLAVRLANVWVMQHQTNHGRLPPAWDGIPTLVHVVATVAALIGLMCWLRCTLPEAFGWRGWAVMTAGAALFGILMAL